MRVEYQKPFMVLYKGETVGEYFADLVVGNAIILKLKATRSLSELHMAQLINYLHISGLRVGYLFNFQPIKVEFRRVIV